MASVMTGTILAKMTVVKSNVPYSCMATHMETTHRSIVGYGANLVYAAHAERTQVARRAHAGVRGKAGLPWISHRLQPCLSSTHRWIKHWGETMSTLTRTPACEVTTGPGWAQRGGRPTPAIGKGFSLQAL
jgi:hypothetical protein